MQTTARLYSLPLGNIRTYGFALLFAAGNMLLPQLCHLIPQGGLIFLPIYFFTLIAGYKYGLRVGLLTALLSPALNHLIFGMPPAHLLTVILVKSVLLAVAGAWMARRTGRVTFVAVAVAIAAYQLFGGLFEWAWTGSFSAAVQDLRIGIPGILLQLFGGYAVLKAIARL